MKSTNQLDGFSAYKVSKVGDRSWGGPEGSFFDSYYTKM